MAAKNSIEQALTRGRVLQENKNLALEKVGSTAAAVAELADEANRRRAELETELAAAAATAQAAYQTAYQAAVKVGWTPGELRSIGFTAPAVTRPRRPKTTKPDIAKTAQELTPPTAPATPSAPDNLVWT